ncbi:TPA: reverse transcriptase domain-containing protein [Photobacterium damselae]
MSNTSDYFDEKPDLRDIFDLYFHGKYHFDEFTNLNIDDEVTKFECNKKVFYSPSKKLKDIHVFLILALFDSCEINQDVAFAYRKGVNIVEAVEKHKNNNLFFKTDIKSFFKNINVDLVEKRILENKSLLLFSNVECYIKNILNAVTYKNEIPIGFSTSPIISNIILKNLDDLLSEDANKNNYVVTRYSDDIITSTKNNSVDLKKITLEKIEHIFKNEYNSSFCINTDKSKTLRKGNKVKILGMVILPNGKITVDKKIKNNVEVSIFNLINKPEKFIDIVNTSINKKKLKNKDECIKYLSGQLNYINSIDKKYIDKLRKKYGSNTIDMLIHSNKGLF